MKRKTLGQYYQDVEDEYSWRKVELRNYKMVVDKTNMLSGRKEPLIRAGVTLLYAHWEGFIASVGEIYINFVNQQKCRADSLSLNLVCLYVQQEARKFHNTYQASLYNGVVQQISVQGAESIQLSPKIETKSNLKYDIFKEVMWKIGIDDAEFILKKELIDRKLVDNRNTIAHGKFCMVDYNDYIELYNAVLDMIERVKILVQNAMERNSHLRQIVKSAQMTVEESRPDLT